jgi:hypothetical protein
MLNYLNQFRPSTAQPHPKPQLALLIYLGSLQQPRCRPAHWRERPGGSSLLALSTPTGAATASILSVGCHCPAAEDRVPVGPVQRGLRAATAIRRSAGRRGPDGGWPRALEQGVMPDRQAPLPPSLRTATRAAYLAGKVRAKAVPVSIQMSWTCRSPTAAILTSYLRPKRSDGQWLPVCPAYLCGRKYAARIQTPMLSTPRLPRATAKPRHWRDPLRRSIGRVSPLVLRQSARYRLWCAGSRSA